jgi:hypothetical protein
MSKRQQLNSSLIKYSRELTPNDDLGPLTNDILANGLKQPIIVDKDLNLIDGLRRLKALDSLSLVNEFDVTVVVCETFDDTCAWISKVIKHGSKALPVTPLRLWQIFSDTYEQQKERGNLARKRRIGLPRGTRTADEVPRTRALLNEALGFGPGEATVSVITHLYRTFISNTDPALEAGLTEIRHRLENGVYTPYTAKGAIDRLMKADMRGDITGLSEQRNALAVSLSQITGANKGTDRIGEIHPGMTQAELLMYIKGFEEARRELTLFIKNLRKRATTP